MEFFPNLDGYKAGPNPVVTIGTFDGVHLGHRVILDRIKQLAEAQRGESVVVSFHPHPRLVLQPNDNSLRLLQTVEEKADSLRALGISKLVLIPFTKEFAATSSESFIKNILVDVFRVHTVVIGYDHRFGKGRGGGLDELRQAGTLYGFKVEEIPAQQIDEANVSSTRIRAALRDGDVQTAAKLLGYRYPLSGVVVHGRKLGRTIGWPTANLHIPEPYKKIPAEGVYAVEAWVRGSRWPSMLNIGRNPTVGEGLPQTIEVHIIGFDADIYAETVTLRFISRIRNEEKFADMATLKAKLYEDRTAVLTAYHEYIADV
jgi:riboflavin kinase/FMN adenylyltransferase